jgi:hypothetical protein
MLELGAITQIVFVRSAERLKRKSTNRWSFSAGQFVSIDIVGMARFENATHVSLK